MNSRIERRRRAYNEQFAVRLAGSKPAETIKRKCLRCDSVYQTDSPYQRLCYDCSHCEESRYWIESEIKLK